jgi:hypothetical protein
MHRLIIAVLSLSLGLVGLSGDVLAQTNSGLVVMDDASGTDGTNGNCDVSGSRRERVRSCRDADSDPESTITDSLTEPPLVAPEPPPAAAPPPAASAPESTDTAVASATDQDADNAPDELEPGLGLDPTNADTDGDHVADGDELNIDGTDPLNGDTDGDGVLDGQELFATHPDPLA